MFSFRNVLILFSILSQIILAQWQEQGVESNATVFFKIAFYNNTGIICGDSGKVLRSIDKGNTWQLINTNSVQAFRFISMNSQAIFIAGRSELLRSINSGSSFSAISFPYTQEIRAIEFVDSLIGTVAAADYIFRTNDGGKSWRYSRLPLSMFSALYFENPARGFGAGYDGSIGAQCFIASTTDSGNTWTKTITQQGEELYDFTFFGDTGFVGGLHTKVFKTTNAGSAWFEPRPVSAPQSEQYYGIHFATPRKGWAAAYVNKIVSTSNGGVDWIKQTIPNSYYTTIYSVFALDTLTAFAVGYTYENNSSRRGLLLKTTNGGVTGTERGQLDGSTDGLGLSFFPNPTACTITIHYHLATTSAVSLSVFNTMGEAIAEVFCNEQQSPGMYKQQVQLQGASGIYLVNLTIVEEHGKKEMFTAKVSLMK